MAPGIKNRITILINMVYGPKSVRAFCLDHHINYVSLHNAFKADAIGIQTVDALKKAIPELNVNWLLYAEGQPLLAHKLPTTFLTNLK